MPLWTFDIPRFYFGKCSSNYPKHNSIYCLRRFYHFILCASLSAGKKKWLYLNLEDFITVKLIFHKILTSAVTNSNLDLLIVWTATSSWLYAEIFQQPYNEIFIVTILRTLRNLAQNSKFIWNQTVAEMLRLFIFVSE